MNEYQGRLYRTYQEILESGSLGEEKEDDEYFDFLSYTYSRDSHLAYEDNQAISDGPHISNCITRKFVVKPIEKAVVTKAYERCFGIFLRWDGTTYHTNMVQTGTKIDMDHYEKITNNKPKRKETDQMNKTDKFPYGGFAIVAIASLVAMLVSIFLRQNR